MIVALYPFFLFWVLVLFGYGFNLWVGDLGFCGLKFVELVTIH